MGSNARAKYVSRLLAPIDKARELVGYEPKTEFKEGLMNTIQWFKDNRDNVEKEARWISLQVEGVSLKARSNSQPRSKYL